MAKPKILQDIININISNEAHYHDTTYHVSTDERNAWNDKADKNHASDHFAGGSDPIAPEVIGAISVEQWEADLIRPATIEPRG